ncbi:methyltransferase regulatory domain-containing protein [Brevundimonas staleyi]|uniref:Class I SAM-dependent methyltransferase n=1 Tax=Brevundimonas staleyi TaxID=74326 RepID=A0ABW0FL27_9CAUL
MSASEGYYSDLEYTSGYYHELGPAHLRFCGLLAGVDCLATEAPVYLELGFGQGVALNVHAAANAGDFRGVDISPAHVANAQVIADATGSGVRLSDDSFAALMARDDLPSFDAIVMHGIWSWVSEENRRIIVDLIRDRLKPGGVVYLSYNCQPGWASLAPLRHLLKLGHAAAPEGDARARIEASLEFMEDVAAADSRFFAENRPAAAHAASLRKVDPLYLAHEYLGEHWHVPYFSDVAEALSEAGMSFLSSARLLDRLDALDLPPAAVALLHRQKDPVMRQSVRDYLVNQQFRPDVFVKDGALLSSADQAARLDAQPFVLICGLDEVDFDVTDAQGEAAMPEVLYAPLAMALAADDFRPKTPVELLAAPGLETARKSDLIKALTTLVGIGVLRPAQAFDEVARMRCEGFNRLVLERAVTGPHLKHLASPAVGGGILSSRSAQLFLRVWLAGARSTEEIAAAVWDVFQITRERAARDGREMITREDNLAALEPMARRFIDQTVPLYRSLGIL